MNKSGSKISSRIGFRPQPRPTPKPDVVSEVNFVLKTAFNDLNFVVALAVSAFIVVTHLDDPHAGIFGDLLVKHANHPYVLWILSNLSKVYGLLLMVPVCFRTPPKYRNYLAVGLASFVLVMPAFDMRTYIIVAVAVFFYINLRSSHYKIFALVVAAYFVYTSYTQLRVKPSATPFPVPV